jgi:DNA topoisomerase-2
MATATINTSNASSSSETILKIVQQPRTRRQKPTANDYQKMEQREHIYQVCDTYIGTDEKVLREEFLLDYTTGTMKYTTITFPQGCERLFLEILSNAGDNVDRSRRMGIDPGQIEIMMDRHTVSVKNNGVPIPIDINEQTNLYAVDMIFGNLLTSSNYDKSVDRTGAGKNGYGAKLTNIFSKQFIVIVADAEKKLKYTQQWAENMTIRGEPIIEPYEPEPATPENQKSYVHVMYQMDFARFGYSEYPDEALFLFARHAADVSVNQKIPVIYNGTTFDVSDIRDYCKLYFSTAKNIIVHYEWPDGTETTTKRNGLIVAKDPNVLPTVELCVIDTPDAGESISFVNGIMTKDGGVHVNSAMKSLSTGILDAINGSRTSSKKSKRGGKPEKKEDKPIKLTLNDVKPHISIVLVCRLLNPKFQSQTKTNLSSPTPSITVPEKTLSPMMKWDLIDRLYMALEAKQFKTLQKMDGKKRRNIKPLKGEDANYAGGPQSRQCTLFVVEGNSAMTYAIQVISLVPQGRNYNGVLPLKGKPLNVMNADKIKVAQNEEFKELSKFLGLNTGLDYTIEENFNTLRYGFLVILADSDDDGKHIIGLILNFFYCYHPTLLKRGFTMYLRTPILRIWKGSERYKFYTIGEFDEWKRSRPDFEVMEVQIL